MASTNVVTIRFSNGTQYTLRQDLLIELYINMKGGDPKALGSDVDQLVDSCAKILPWFEVEKIAEKVETNESSEWSQRSFDVVKVEE